jgi:hypothetical protein
MAGLRVTEVPFAKYRTIELFCFQGADFIENLRNLGFPKKNIPLIDSRRKHPKYNHVFKS